VSAEPMVHSSTDEASRTAHSKATKEAAQRNMLLGTLLCSGGIVILLLASFGAGRITYVVATGALIVGGIQFLHGLIQASE
jgi:hypothetical protein